MEIRNTAEIVENKWDKWHEAIELYDTVIRVYGNSGTLLTVYIRSGIIVDYTGSMPKRLPLWWRSYLK